MQSRYFTTLLALGLAALCGCDSNAKVYPVKGTVNYQGKPMKGGGSIAFMPLGGQSGKAAGGEIKEDGTYELSTYLPGDGSMPGEFRVVITQSTVKEPGSTQDGEKAAKIVADVPASERIPLSYADPMNSPLKATVEAKENVIQLDLVPDAGGRPRGGA